MLKVRFVREDKAVAVNSGANLRKVARQNGVQIYRGLNKFLNCRGLGLCGTCLVGIEKGGAQLSPPTRSEEKLLAKKGLNPETHRLACQCYVHADVDVRTLT